jgi:hypothetical protein
VYFAKLTATGNWCDNFSHCVRDEKLIISCIFVKQLKDMMAKRRQQNAVNLIRRRKFGHNGKVIPVILLSVLPVFLAWLWLKRKVNINTPYFLTALAAGILSLALAALFQMLLPDVRLGMTRGRLFVILARAASIEEGSRLAALLLFVFVPRLFNRANVETAGMAAAGMAAGLAFAAIETASFAASVGTNSLARLLRLSAVLLHAACGIRCALAAFALLSKKISFLLSLARAIALHTVYNFITLHDGARYYILGLLLTLSSFISGLRYMKGPNAGE